MPRSVDVMVYKQDTILGQPNALDAQIQVLEITNDNVGDSSIGFV